MSRWSDKATQAFETEQSIQRFLRANKAVEKLKQDYPKWIETEPGKGVVEAMERRLTKHPDGTVTGHFKPQEKIGGPLNNVQSCFPSQATSILGSPGISPVTTGLATTFGFTPSLTVDQRLNELKKKIAEYRAMLNVVNDATTRNLVDLFLVNISKELNEIQAEFNKIPKQQQPLLQPSFPSPPFVPTSPSWPSIGDNIMYTRSDEITEALKKGVEIVPGYTVAINNEGKEFK